MSDTNVRTIEDVKKVLKNKKLLKFEKLDRKEAYAFAEKTLRKLNYLTASKRNKGFIKQYIILMTGYKESQVKRFIKQYKDSGYVRMIEYKRHTFPKKYTDADVQLLAETDDAHDNPNGKALKKICQDEYKKYNKQEYRNLSRISVAHIYNLRSTTSYRRIAKGYNPTKPTINVSIGVREKPHPEGVPGYLRIDTVHQGDNEKQKGLYHLNIIDEVTQFEYLAALPQISQACVEPMLEDLLQSFPFKIINFHSDNGSEYINHTVAKLLNRLGINQTKSRSRKTNDNALVETKNGSIVRKNIGYGFMNQDYADAVNRYYKHYYNFYLNFYRPCGFATDKVDKRGKITKVYKPEDYKSPYEAFKAIPGYKKYLNPAFDVKALEETMLQYSPTEFVKILNKARSKLLRNIEVPNLHLFDIARFVNARSGRKN